MALTRSVARHAAHIFSCNPPAIINKPVPRPRRFRLIYILALIFLYYNPAFPEVYKRVHKDGTIEYYNKKDPAPLRGGHLGSRYDAVIERLSAAYGVDPLLIKCMVKIESNFNPDAVSPAGAMGLMQIMQETADYYNLDNPFDPEKNIETGIRHLKSMLGFFKNDTLLALAAYHAGLGRVKKTGSMPPIKSTIDYVDRVMLLYTGSANYSGFAVKRLYKKVEQDGTILIYSR
jgi:soluble lytic murein transglycosylase-like protein